MKANISSCYGLYVGELHLITWERRTAVSPAAIAIILIWKILPFRRIPTKCDKGQFINLYQEGGGGTGGGGVKDWGGKKYLGGITGGTNGCHRYAGVLGEGTEGGPVVPFRKGGLGGL